MISTGSFPKAMQGGRKSGSGGAAHSRTTTSGDDKVPAVSKKMPRRTARVTLHKSSGG